ncbi:hypothetical protein Srot_1184 [Segniliparus rotundus DSM 44985]|uniref:Uncharacterized protein n=1 Tax=Segniliparus rotundus (strain ATCC BAA-972 / CDC 1076 / CIP 108378 / DSM 44985 / JCM 13578) TaxID=640132 RepID=D6ZFD1_SEGRD|nr:hypothetical protein [Segniliparus rotundus]ADG97655.1 hypothetical protein Srot_1184 [Segniliparus rotundus DSM 44985]
MSAWRATRTKTPSKTIRCEDCVANWGAHLDSGGQLPGPQVRCASVSLTAGEARHKLCGPCYAERKLAHDQEEKKR